MGKGYQNKRIGKKESKQTAPMIDEENEALSVEDMKKSIPTKAFMQSIKKPTTIRLRADTLFYFQSLAQETGIAYQTLINMYLDDCAKNKRCLHTEWK